LQNTYKYPQSEFPYGARIKNKRSREPEYEILDTQSFDKMLILIALSNMQKQIPMILMKVTVVNRGSTTAEIHVLPQLWFRNF
jgi:superfamily I DNA and RNA helicase